MYHITFIHSNDQVKYFVMWNEISWMESQYTYIYRHCSDSPSYLQKLNILSGDKNICLYVFGIIKDFF